MAEASAPYAAWLMAILITAQARNWFTLSASAPPRNAAHFSIPCGVLPASSHGRRTPPARSCVRARGNARRPRQGHVSPYTTIGTRRGSREGTPSPAGGLVAFDATAGEGHFPVSARSRGCGQSALAMTPAANVISGSRRSWSMSRRCCALVDTSSRLRFAQTSHRVLQPWAVAGLGGTGGLTHGPTEPKGVNGLPTRSPRSQTGSAAAFSAAVSPRARWYGRTRLPPAIAVNRFDNRQTGVICLTHCKTTGRAICRKYCLPQLQRSPPRSGW